MARVTARVTSRTEANLQVALTGEADANRRYVADLERAATDSLITGPPSARRDRRGAAPPSAAPRF